MREIKSVKVDNWGVFFLQKLQNFFNKTDYCDLTLQFKDNSQLKVHRLVLSACTDYFNVLEQNCEVVDDVLIMPAGLQADVIVPIVNFMYTGTLEFEIDMYGRLLKTARDMNMTVLLKLLEAHKRTVDSSRAQSQLRRVPKSFVNRRTPNPPRVERNYPAHSITVGGDHRRTVPVSSHQLKTLQIKHVSPSTSYYQTESATKYVENTAPAKGPSRFEYSDETTLPPDSFEQFDSISYESKPLITANQVSKEDIDDYDNLIPAHDTSSTFEQLRKSYTSNKRPSSSVSSFGSPPEKKPNIQDVKEYAEQQRMRKQITAEYDDENEYDEVLDDAFPNDDDDEDYVPPVHLQKTMRKHAPALVIKQEKDQKPTIVVKDTVGSNVNHAKIISEVLKKYPHLVKNNKNIKLKIMAKSGTSPNQQQSIVIKQEPETEFIPTTQPQPAPKTITVGAPRAANIQTSLVKQPVQMQKTIAPQPTSVVAKPQQPAPQKLTTTTKIVTQKVPVTTNPAPRRIDSKTMHSLIALGAENTSGPWLCLRCGVNGRPISIPSYRGFRRHLLNIHKEKINSRLCEHCGWRSGNDAELYHHMRVQHDILPPARYNFPACLYCPSIFLDKASFDQHMRETHPDKITYRQQCMYCDEVFIEESDLFTHMNTQHKAQAHKDGLIDYTDDEDTAFYGSERGQATDKKIKILSSITISPQSAIKPETSKLGAAALGSVATGIATSLGLIDSTDSQEIQFLDSESAFMGSVSGSSQEPKFVNADGQIMELTQEQRDEIMSQLQNQAEGGVVMVLNQDSFAAGAVSGAEDTAKLDNSEENLLVAMPDEQTEQKVSDEKETVDGDEKMDWQADASQEISEPDVAKPKDAEVPEKNDDEAAVKTEEEKDAVNTSIEDNEANTSAQTEEESSTNKKDENEKLEKAKEKLKLLAGDWSDDEDENDETIETTAEDTANTSKQSESIEPAEQAANDQRKSLDEEKEIIFETVTAVPPDDKDELAHKPADESKNDDSAAEVDQVAETEAIAEENREEEEVQTESTTEARQKDNEKNANDAVVKETETEVKIESEADTSIAEEVPEKELDKEKEKSKKVSDDNKAKKEDQTDDHIQSLISDWGEEEDEDL